MGRPLGGKNHMRTPEEKEAIVLEYLDGRAGYKSVAQSHDINERLLHRWIEKYRENGIEGLTSKKEETIRISENITAIYQK